jgi:hypothetical protein
MRTETFTKTFYKFEELSAEAQARAIEAHWDINVTDNFWSEGVIEDRTAVLKELGFYDIEVQYSGFSSQGDGASFTALFHIPASGEELAERIRQAKAYAPEIDLSLFEKIDFFEYSLGTDNYEIFRINRSYSHENTISSNCEALKEFARDFSQDTYHALRNEYDFQTSEDQVKESLIANEIEFEEITK